MYLGNFDCPIGAWVHHYAGMHNASLTGPLFRLLVASWQQSPTGTLPNDNEWLARMCQMSVTQFESVKEELLGGFVATGIRWSVPELVDKAQQLEEYHGAGFARLSASATAAVLEPEHFSLQAVTQAPEKRQYRKKKPEGYCLSPALLSWGIRAVNEHAVANLATRAPTDEEAKAVMVTLMEQFCQNADAKDYRYQDWDKAFQLFATRQMNGSFGRISQYLPDLFPVTITPVVGIPGSTPGNYNGFRSRAGRTKRDELAAGNDDALAQVTAMIQGRSSLAVNEIDDHDTIEMPLTRSAQ